MARITYQDFNLKLSGDGGHYTAAVLSSPEMAAARELGSDLFQAVFKLLYLHDHPI